MTYLLEDEEDIIPTKPQNVIGMHICEYKNQAGDECQGRYEYFIDGTQNNPLHGKIEKKGIWIDKTTQRPPAVGQSTDGLELELMEKNVASDYFF